MLASTLTTIAFLAFSTRSSRGRGALLNLIILSFTKRKEMHLIQLKIVLLTTRPTTRGQFDSHLVVRFSVLMSLLSFYMLYLLSCYKYLNLFGGFALSYHKYEIKLHIRKPFVRKDCWRRNILRVCVL